MRIQTRSNRFSRKPRPQLQSAPSGQFGGDRDAAKITAISHAITMLGGNSSNVGSSSFSLRKEAKGIHNPLMQTATLRGGSWSFWSNRGPIFTGDGVFRSGFMTGLLSLIDVLLGTPMKEVVEQLNLTDDVRQALLAHEGSLGLLLSLVSARKRPISKGWIDCSNSPG